MHTHFGLTKTCNYLAMLDTELYLCKAKECVVQGNVVILSYAYTSIYMQNHNDTMIKDE